MFFFLLYIYFSHQVSRLDPNILPSSFKPQEPHLSLRREKPAMTINTGGNTLPGFLKLFCFEFTKKNYQLHIIISSKDMEHQEANLDLVESLNIQFCLQLLQVCFIFLIKLK